MNDEMNEMLIEAMIPQIVSRLAKAAVKLGGDAEDTNGAVKALCQRAGLDVFRVVLRPPRNRRDAAQSPEDRVYPVAQRGAQNMENRTMKFQMGQVVATPGAMEALQESGTHPLALIRRHITGDWGDLDAEDIAANDAALIEDTRLLSAYTLADGTKLWIITEADRSSTTLLLPEEY